MVVSQARPLAPPGDTQTEAWLNLTRLEVVLQVGDHPVHRVSVEQQEAVVVTDGVQTLQ